MADLSTLGRTLRVRAAQVGRNVSATQRRATKALGRELILGTPVDRGVARSNWQAGATANSAGLRPAFAPGRHLGISETRNASAAIAALYAAVDRAPTGSDLYVSNPVEYIDLLDKGLSPQASAGLVKRAIAVAGFEVRRRKIFVNDRT